MTSVLTQDHGDKKITIAYFSTDPVASGLPLCLRAVAAVEKAVLASRDLVGYGELTLMVPHAVTHILHTRGHINRIFSVYDRLFLTMTENCKQSVILTD